MAKKIERALISTWRKDGIGAFGKWLTDLGVEVLSTGGTAACLRDAEVPVVDVAKVTEFPEMMDGRVKTLHPRIHGGLLFRRDRPGHVASAKEHGIPSIDLLVVDLYPFEDVAAKEDSTREDCVEMIDIGGPAMIRAAAKNHADVCVITDPADLEALKVEMDANEGGISRQFRRSMAAKAFRTTAAYDAAIAGYLTEETWPEKLVVAYDRKAIGRYGENPHQGGAVYRSPKTQVPGPGVAGAHQVSGKALSYNNYLDASAAWDIVRGHRDPVAVAFIKHRNPCGAALHESDVLDAFKRAHGGDPLSAFGGIVAINRSVDADLAREIADPKKFLEVILAHGFSAEALKIIQEGPRWGKNVRLLQVEPDPVLEHPKPILDIRSIHGGVLVQDRDEPDTPDLEFKVVTERAPTDEEIRDLRFAWDLCRNVTSNAIVLVKNETLLGCGAGQMSRVDSVGLAQKKAGEAANGSVLASDAFFPFADGILTGIKAGARAVVQPGGSKRDKEVIAACNEYNVAMVFTGKRHFRH